MSFTHTDLGMGQILFTVIDKINLEWVHLSAGWDTGDGTSAFRCQLSISMFFICGNCAGNLWQLKLTSLEGNMILISSHMSWAKNVHRNSYCGSTDLQQHSVLCLSPQSQFWISEALAKQKRWKRIFLICHEHFRNKPWKSFRRRFGSEHPWWPTALMNWSKILTPVAYEMWIQFWTGLSL